MHESTTRLFKAIQFLLHREDLPQPGEVAQIMGVQPAVITNWSKRGVSKEGLLLANSTLQINPYWIESGQGDMSFSSSTVDQMHSLHADQRMPTSAHNLFMNLQDRLRHAFPEPRTRGVMASIANECGVKPPSVWNWFNSPDKVAELSRKHAETICEKFNLNINPIWLAEGIGEMTNIARSLPNSESSGAMPVTPTLAQALGVLANWAMLADDLSRDQICPLVNRIFDEPHRGTEIIARIIATVEMSTGETPIAHPTRTRLAAVSAQVHQELFSQGRGEEIGTVQIAAQRSWSEQPGNDPDEQTVASDRPT